jgi:hypothetical protein
MLHFTVDGCQTFLILEARGEMRLNSLYSTRVWASFCNWNNISAIRVVYNELAVRVYETRPDQSRPDQTRPDQTRPNQTRPDPYVGFPLE